MVEAIPLDVYQHDDFRDWLLDLRDVKARARISMRLRRLELGNPGDFKPLGDGVSERRIDYGPGYRVYYMTIGLTVVLFYAAAARTRRIMMLRGLNRWLRR